QRLTAATSLHVDNAAVSVAQVGNQRAKRAALGIARRRLVGQRQLRLQSLVPVDLGFLEIRIEMTKDVPGDDHVREPDVDVGLIDDRRHRLDRLAQGFSIAGLGGASSQRERYSSTEPEAE